MIKKELIDARNWSERKEALVQEIASADLIGFDLETEDSGRHEGLNRFMKVNAEGHKSKGKKLVFDVNRTVVCGFSWYCDGSDTAYYLNLAHADVENRIPWSEAVQLLEARKPDAHWIAHNAPFELTMTAKSLGYVLTNVICTLQMAVSAFNEDQYNQQKMFSCGFGEMQKLLAPIANKFAIMDPYDLNDEQEELLSKIIGKTTKSTFSYNGLVDSLKYGYGLKQLTKSLFGYEQQTFEETLNGEAHMGQITGEECCEYGADDAYWAVRIFHEVLPMLVSQNDQLVNTFLEQENPMIEVFSQIQQNGMRVNLEAIYKRREAERVNYANTVRRMHQLVNQLLPFPEEPNSSLMKQGWYSKSNGASQRRKIEQWARRPLPESDFSAAMTTRSPVTAAWAFEKGLPESKGPNLAYYMMQRILMFDLHGCSYCGSDKEGRAKALKKYPEMEEMITLLNELATIDQVMKLYLNPYTLLADPETQRFYPVVSSMLNSRRMASALPNPMQLAKRGETTYIRGFFLGDEEDHVVVSIDWSQIELVLIGDFSGDEGFREAYGQLPFKDLHRKAAADVLEVSPDQVSKADRTKIGKGANFNYWYSGALSTVGDVMGWSSDRMWEATDAYRSTFADAEEWRVDLIAEAREHGFITLPDGHRRTLFEATYEWQQLWTERWANTGYEGLKNFGQLFVKKLTNRAANKIVNSMIQGSCATLAKRSILRINKRIEELGIRARFMIPIHDELVFSVHRDDVVLFIREAKRIMCDHPDIIKNLAVDATASVGRTFEPYHPEKAPFGQIELDEAPPILGFEKDAKLNDAEIERVVQYLYEEIPYDQAA